MVIDFNDPAIPLWLDWKMWSAIGAFAGFTFGTWIKYGFDSRFHKKTRQEKNLAVARILQSEISELHYAVDDLHRWASNESNISIVNGRFRQNPPILLDTSAYESLCENIGYLPHRLVWAIGGVYSEYRRLYRDRINMIYKLGSETEEQIKLNALSLRNACLAGAGNIEKVGRAVDKYASDPCSQRWCDELDNFPEIRESILESKTKTLYQKR